MWVSALIALPLVAAVAVLLSSRLDDSYPRYVALAGSVAAVAAAAYVWLVPYDSAGNALVSPGEAALVERVPWFEIGGYEVEYIVGLDGVSMPLVALTTLLVASAIATAWNSVHEREAGFYTLVLVLESALIGVFVALDFFAYYVFWEAVLVPMYFLIAVWGGPRRKYAAMKFFVYTNIASLVMFVGVVALYLSANVADTSMMSLTQALHEGALTGAFGLSADAVRLAAFLALFVGFAVKVPVVPFHTWLPDAHVQAPTPVSVILAGVLLKMGTYSLLRFNFTMLPETASALALPLAVVGVVSVIYGALLAMAQTDLKRIVAYSSVSSMGYVVVGLAAYTSYSVGGATFQMVSHGLVSGLMFTVVGVVYHETGTREVGELSGLASRAPLVAGVFVAASFAYMGLPGMSGFPAELFVFLGGMSSSTLPYAPIVVAAAMFGIVLVAGYLLFATQRVLFGEFRLGSGRAAADGGSVVTDASLSDAVPMLVLLAAIVVLGVQPDLVYDTVEVATDALAELPGGGA